MAILRPVLRLGLTMLVGDRAKFLGILLGVSFAALLITLQGSMFAGVMYRTIGLIRDTGAAQIWVMDPKVQFIDDLKPLADADLDRVRSVPGVAWAVPFFKGVLRARLNDGTYQSCTVLGLDDTSLTGGPPKMVAGRLEDLRRADGVIVDALGARTKLARTLADGTRWPLAIGDELELSDRRAVVVGLCEVSKVFGSFPTIYTTYRRATAFAPPERRQMSFVIAQAAGDTDPLALCASISKATGLQALTQDGFARATVVYFLRNTPIPINIGLGVILSFLIGAAITGLTFHQFVHENLRYLGALKAMGATDAMLARLTIVQAMTVGFIGYGCGTGLACLIGYLMRNTEAQFRTPWYLLVFCAVAVAVICGLAALVGLRKVVKLEPAIVFRS